jgi:hypothetical protein
MPNTMTDGKLVGGGTGSPQSCYCCGNRYVNLCDHPMTGRVFAGLTCDNKICAAHSIKQPNGKHYCPYHDEKASANVC